MRAVAPRLWRRPQKSRSQFIRAFPDSGDDLRSGPSMYSDMKLVSNGGDDNG